MLNLISLKTLFQCAPRSGGHPEDQAIFPADTGHVRVQRAAPGVVPLLAVAGTEPVYWPGCRVCAIGAPRGSESESFKQQMYQPFLTICDGTKPAAPTAPSTGLPTATALGRPPPGFAPPAARAGKGPAGSPGPVEQQYASHHARMEGALSSQAAVTTLQDGRATPARQTWTNAVLEGGPVPRTASTPRVPGSGRAQPIRRRCALPAQVKDSQGSPAPHDRNGRCGRRGGAEASVKTGCAGAEAAAGAGPTAQSGLEGPGAQAA